MYGEKRKEILAYNVLSSLDGKKFYGPFARVRAMHVSLATSFFLRLLGLLGVEKTGFLPPYRSC